jgi:hypothetical protein
MLKGIEIIKDRLQRKRKQYIHQGEKIEQMKCTMQNTGEEIEQLEYVLNEMEHIADVNRAPRVIPNARVEEVFAYLCRVFEFLQHRLKLHFKYKLSIHFYIPCPFLVHRYKFKLFKCFFILYQCDRIEQPTLGPKFRNDSGQQM